MSKVTIPRPVAVLWKEERPYQEPLTRLELWPPFEPLEIFDPLITTTQAEAYANARVREALEETIDKVALHGGSVEIEAAIRALLPSTPA